MHITCVFEYMRYTGCTYKLYIFIYSISSLCVSREMVYLQILSLHLPMDYVFWYCLLFMRFSDLKNNSIYIYIHEYICSVLAAWWSKLQQGTFNVLWSRFKSTVLPVGGVGKYMSNRFGNQVMFLEISRSCCQHVEVTFYKRMFYMTTCGMTGQRIAICSMD